MLRIGKLSLNKYYVLLFILTVIYLIGTFAVSPDKASLAKYHIDATQLRVLSLTIVVPLLAIWFAAFYGLVNLGKYAERINGTRDGEGFKYLVISLTFLAFSFPVNSLISGFLKYLVNNGTIIQATSTIITTHLSLAFSLIAYIFLAIGSQRLLKTIKKAKVRKSYRVGAAVALFLIAIPYVYAALTNPSREVAVAPSLVASYYMSDILTVTTILAPYIILWGIGISGVLQLYAYKRTVGGNVYKKSLSKITFGFLAVILANIFVQFLTTLATIYAGWGLGTILILVYLLLVVVAIGYVFIALGAKGLAKIEEVI
jgi:hypothetical protein